MIQERLEITSRGKRRKEYLVGSLDDEKNKQRENLISRKHEILTIHINGQNVHVKR